MIIQGVTLTGLNVYDSSFNSNGALLYLDAGTSASYSGSGTTWTDLSTYQNNATLTGSPPFTNAGAASYFSFNGTNQFAPVTTSKMNVSFTGKTTIFAIRTVNANTGNAVYRNLFGGDTNARNFNTYMYHVSGSTWQINFSTGPTNPWASPQSASFTVTDNEWIIIAATQTTGGVVTFYVNGQQIGAPATGVTFSQFINSGIEAVARADNYWRGDIGVCAIYGRALSADEIKQNYNALSTRYSLPPVSSNLVSYYNPGSTASYTGTGTTLTDLSGNGLTGTLTNITYTSPYFTYNGTSATASVADNALLEPGSGDWTIEAWVYYSVITGSSRVIVGKTDGGNAADWSYGIRTQANGATYMEVGNGTTSITSPPYTVTTGQWYQVVGVYTNVGTKSIALYVNGAIRGTNSHSFASIKNSTRPMFFGSFDGGATFGQWFNGRMGIVRLYNKALSASEVLQNYNADRSTYGL